MRYIELNPVRAHNMAAHPADYPWSSYRYNALGKADPLLTPHREYTRLGPTAEKRQAAYRQLFRTHIPQSTLAAIREATNKAWVLGSDRFTRKMEKTLVRPAQSRGHGGDRKSVRYRRAVAQQNHRV